MLPLARQVEMLIDPAQDMIVRNNRFEIEGIKQLILREFLLSHHRRYLLGPEAK